MSECWLPVVGFEGRYEVSNKGRVRSIDHVVAIKGQASRKIQGRMLSPGRVKSGHMLVCLGRGNPQFVHTLVLEAHVGPRPDGLEGCHWDDDGSNNQLSNLRWDTRSANMHDSVRNGRHGSVKRGERL